MPAENVLWTWLSLVLLGWYVQGYVNRDKNVPGKAAVTLWQCFPDFWRGSAGFVEKTARVLNYSARRARPAAAEEGAGDERFGKEIDAKAGCDGDWLGICM